MYQYVAIFRASWQLCQRQKKETWQAKSVMVSARTLPWVIIPFFIHVSSWLERIEYIEDLWGGRSWELGSCDQFFDLVFEDPESKRLKLFHGWHFHSVEKKSQTQSEKQIMIIAFCAATSSCTGTVFVCCVTFIGNGINEMECQ